MNAHNEHSTAVPSLCCTACGSADLRAELWLRDQPTILNYRCASRAEARAITRRDIHLIECGECGLVFNSIFDPAAVPYDEQYENTQCHSAAFSEHLQGLADRWTRRFDLAGRHILEVGCGKGDFLRLICRTAGARGYGYDTSFEDDAREPAPGVEFFSHYLDADTALPHPVDLIVCRHVVEHVPQIGRFLSMLHALSVGAGGVPVVIETPAWEWIVDHQAFWDVFYEHCNYFSQPTLREVAERAGFETLDQQRVFGDQYQIIELVPHAAGAERTASAQAAPHRLERFARALTSARDELAERLSHAGADAGWAIWGAGAKGVALTNTLTAAPPAFVIDSNPAKQGGFIPGSGVSVVSPDDPRIADMRVVLIANSNYLDEISATLTDRGLAPEFVTL